jgi:hypothetical protein
MIRRALRLRRVALQAAACAVLGACGGGGGSSAIVVPAAVKAAADDAFRYGYPLTETMRVCDLAPAVNVLSFKSTLATAQDRAVVAPNNDTLYGSACLYLGASWVKLTMPPAGGRYMSLQVLDAYTNNAGIRGPLQIPAAGASYAIVRSGTTPANLPSGLPTIEVPTPYAYLITRTLVDGPADLSAADATQRRIVLEPDSTAVPARTPIGATGNAGYDFFLKLMLRLAQNPPPAVERSLVAAFADAGISATLAPALARASADQLAAWDAAYPQGLAALDASAGVLGSLRGAWSIPVAELGRPGSDYLLRAVTARRGLFALTRDEAMYVSTSIDATGAALDGRRAVALRLPAGWPPVDPRGFWSLTMYGPDGFLVANAIDRYSIGGRTPGVQREADGSLLLAIQCTDPGGARTANWLPAPCGPFYLTMRLYLPTAAVAEPGFTIPAVQRAD